MKKLFTFNIGETMKLGLLKDLVEAEGIPCAIRNEQLSMAECYPELWILIDEDYARAKELLDRWLNPQNRARASWICPNCGEKIEGQFGSCWRCGKTQE